MNISSIHSLPGPENILRRQFPNGVTVLIRANPFSQTVSIRGAMPCGKFLDPADKPGTALFVAECLTSGTRKHDFTQINEQLEYAGASLGFSSATRTMSFEGKCLTEDFPMLLGLLHEVLNEPVFPEAYLEVTRSRILSSYELHLDDPDSMSAEKFDELLYGKHPYGISDYGTRETIQSISREDLVRFHKNYVGPKGLILAIVGGVDPAQTLALCEQIFGGWEKSQLSVCETDYFPALTLPESARSLHVEIPEKSEMSLVIGTLGPCRKDPAYSGAKVGNCILGQFGMMGRIGKVVREDNGLAYYAGSDLDALRYGGSWAVSAGVNPRNVDKAADLIIQELRRFTSEKVTELELEDVKSYYIGSLPLSLESNASVAAALLRMESGDLGLDHYVRMPGEIQSVTAEAVLETARAWLNPDKMLRVTAGTAAE